MKKLFIITSSYTETENFEDFIRLEKSVSVLQNSLSRFDLIFN